MAGGRLGCLGMLSDIAIISVGSSDQVRRLRSEWTQVAALNEQNQIQFSQFEECSNNLW